MAENPPAPAEADDWGPLPSEGLDWWAIAQQQGGVPPFSQITVTVPGGQPVELEMTAGAVSKQLGTGYRHTAKVDVVPLAGVWDLVTTPGALFHITFGWQFGPREMQRVTRPMGVYLLGEVPKASRANAIELNLVDLWKRIEDSRLQVPWTSALGITRADQIVLVVNTDGTLLDVPVTINATGGEINRALTVERERSEIVTTLARDGQLHVFFDADGSLVIDREPILLPSRSVATFTDGEGATILDLSRQVQFTRLYNAVICNPITDGDNPQSWARVVVHVADPEHPRHRDKVGVIPGFFSSPTLTTRARALAAAQTRLQTLMQELETVEVQTWARPDIEPGDTFSTVETETYQREQRYGTWLVVSVEFDLLELGTRITGRSSAVDDVEEEVE